jgi:hypothetical protein
MPRGYSNQPNLPEWLILPIVLIIVAFIGYVIVKALAKAEPEFGEYGWYLYGLMIFAIGSFMVYSWLQKLRGPRY